MNLPANPNTLSYMTPRAFDAARMAGIAAMEPNPDAIERIGKITAGVGAKFALPVAARGLTIVIRGGDTTLMPHKWDGSFADAGDYQNYIPIEELGALTPYNLAQTTKANIIRSERPFLELSVRRFDAPLGPALGAKILGVSHDTDPKMEAAKIMTENLNLRFGARCVAALRKIRRENLEPYTITWRRGPAGPSDSGAPQIES